MRKLACSTIVLLLLGGALCAADSSFRTVLPETILDRLAQEGSLRNSLNRESQPLLIPDVPARARIVERIREMGFTVGTEVLAIYSNDTVDFDLPASRLKIYNILRSFSTMQGIEYYSASRERMRTLFAQSYVVDGPENGRKVPDPVAERIPASSRLYVFQEDLTFGENTYVNEFRYSGDFYLVESRNLTTMRYFLFPMVKPGDSATMILLIPDGTRILFYGAGGARTMRLLGLERSREDSFYNRIKAIYGWFSDRMDGSF